MNSEKSENPLAERVEEIGRSQIYHSDDDLKTEMRGLSLHFHIGMRREMGLPDMTPEQQAALEIRIAMDVNAITDPDEDPAASINTHTR